MICVVCKEDLDFYDHFNEHWQKLFEERLELLISKHPRIAKHAIHLGSRECWYVCDEDVEDVLLNLDMEERLYWHRNL